MNNIKKPTLIKNPNFDDLIETLKEYIDFWVTYPEEGCEDIQTDYEHPVMEQCILAFFGKECFNYINQQIDENDRINYEK